MTGDLGAPGVTGGVGDEAEVSDVDWLAALIRLHDGNHDKGAGVLAEALWPHLAATLAQREAAARAAERERIASLFGERETEQALTEFMSKHVQSHRNSNSPLSWGCDGPCASQAALVFAASLARTGTEDQGVKTDG